MSSGIVVATPVYKGALSGAHKLILDVIPPDALEGKVTLGPGAAIRVRRSVPKWGAMPSRTRFRQNL